MSETSYYEVMCLYMYISVSVYLRVGVQLCVGDVILRSHVFVYVYKCKRVCEGGRVVACRRHHITKSCVCMCIYIYMYE